MEKETYASRQKSRLVGRHGDVEGGPSLCLSDHAREGKAFRI
jgi:hypothetical protein